MTKIITSQDYLNEEIVAEKVAAGDFAIFVSPTFEIDGVEYQVLLDGHHSLAAAVAAGVDADVNVYDATDHDAIALLDAGKIEDFLAVTHMGADYRDAMTGEYVW